MKLTSRQTLVLLAAVCVLPVAASYLSFYVWTPDKTVNYGQLLGPTPIQRVPLSALDGKAFALEALRGKWIMIHTDVSACEAPCRKRIYYMRQVRTALGKEMDRVERVWLLSDDGVPDPALLKDYPGMHVVRGAGSALLAQLAAHGAAGSDLRDHVFVIDPLGNLMLRFPADPEPKNMLKDLERLLKVSRIG